MQQSIKRQKMAVSRYASKESHSFPAETLEETGEAVDAKCKEIAPVRSHLSEKGAKKSEKTRIHQKLKSRKESDVAEDVIDRDEDEGKASPDAWQGAVLSKSKAPRRKPRFLF